MLFSIFAAFPFFDPIVLPFRLLFFNEFIEHLGSFLTVFPNAAQLQNWAKSRSFQFINVMIYFIGTVHKLRYRVIYCNLNFTIYRVVEFGNNHDVICGIFQSVFNFNYFEFLRILICYSWNLLENAQNLLLFWRVFASHQIWNVECNQVVGWGPVLFKWRHLRVTYFRDFGKPVYESIQIVHNKALNIVDYFAGKFSWDSLVFFKVKIVWVLDFILQQMHLLFIIDVLNFFHESDDLFFLINHLLF